MLLSQALREFIEYLEVEKNRAPLTIRNYQFYLGRFVQWAVERGVDTTADVTAEHVRLFRLWLHRYRNRQGEALSVATQNYHLIALRAWFRYLAKRDILMIAAEKIELGKITQRHVSFLEQEELERILEAPSQEYKRSQASAKRPVPLRRKRIALRDAAILELLFSTGLRVGEIVRLTLDDVNTKRDAFTVRGKGGKLRMVFVSKRAREALKYYREARTDLSPFLFVRHDLKTGSREQGARGRRGAVDKKQTEERPLTARSIERIVNRYAKIAGITKPVSPHTLRHTFATDLLKAGADIRSVQTLLGHSSIITTQIYTHITDQRLREVHQQYHGKGGR